MTQTRRIHWASLLTLVVFGFGLLIFLAAFVFASVSSIVHLIAGTGAPAAEMIGAFAFGFHALLLIVCAWFVLQKTRGIEQADAPLKIPFTWSRAAAAIAVPVASALIGGMVSLAELEWLSWVFLPLLTLLVVVPPIWLYFGAGSNGLETGARWRFFAIFGLGMTAAPFIMILLEIVFLLFGVFAVSVYLAVTDPLLFAELTDLAGIITEVTDPEAILQLAAPYIANPVILIAGFGYLAILVPLIEEFFKPLAVWLFAKQIDSPAQGFVLGMASGAAFGLLESLNASADGSTGWAVVVAARAGTSLLHIVTSGLAGWGVVAWLHAVGDKDLGITALEFTGPLFALSQTLGLALM
ncbi:MAG: hypothetical protein DPW18_20345, partial [Chloroflexi bacterium]|nr:hypothetical protein [Chloroflexota bacterium]